MAILGRRICVAIPETVLEERDSQRDKTAKIGLIARACAIYGVDVIQVYKDEIKRGEARLICRVLEYLETPQYLRRRLFPIDETLRFAGFLPPLKIPSHKPKVPIEDVSAGDVREGVTNMDGTVDIGLDANPRLKGPRDSNNFTGGTGSPNNRRVTIRIVSTEPLLAEEVQRGQFDEYWGYSVEVKRVSEIFSDDRFSLTISTSRFGNSLKSTLPRLRSAFREAAGVKLIFGSPTRGLFDIVGPNLAEVSDFVVNLFAAQQVETVRSEEAIFAGLGLLNVLAVSESLSANRETGFGKG